jgi:sodium transport system permease protein
LFSENERLDLKLWLKRLYLDRKPTPTVAAAMCCAVVILMAKFFVGFAVDIQNDLSGLMQSILIPQLAVILAPALLMTFLLTRNPAQSLLLKWPSRWTAVAVFAALFLAVAIHPLMTVLQTWVRQLFPINEEVKLAMEKLQGMFGQADIRMLILLIAFVPAVCEELAFRGFILSGFRHLGYKWRAIALSAFFFGVTHGILQQSMITFLVGLVLGYIAIQSGSILPGIIFHFTHNSLIILHGYLADYLTPELCARRPWLNAFVTVKDGVPEYSWLLIGIGSVLAVLILGWFGMLSYPKTAEERLREAIVRGQEEHPEDEDISISLASMIK